MRARGVGLTCPVGSARVTSSRNNIYHRFDRMAAPRACSWVIIPGNAVASSSRACSTIAGGSARTRVSPERYQHSAPVEVHGRPSVDSKREVRPTFRFPDLQRTFSTTARRNGTTSVSDQIRHLMRDSAQPVAIITSFLREGNSDLPSKTSNGTRLVHGATLSSFTTVSLDPSPLVAFSFKLPSRMAQSLVEHHQSQREPQAHFIINVLADNQGHLAGAFARPGLKPYEWDVGQKARMASNQEQDDIHPLAKEDTSTLKESAHARSGSHGVPLLDDSIGCLACSLEGWVDLGRLGRQEERIGMHNEKTEEGDAVGSRLFIARVHAVEGRKEHDKASTKKPLVYWKQKFTSVQ